ncbi:MAG: calcium-translocating P-type ATPase, SERCA-type [Sarcina ventriculi]|uniref:calcium-translocating P-type ATPase, SERCA-type n=1 Tax=Sarcina ventriculi TaxID=1267 RepID=UPI0009E7D5BF|nr:calcium-translocating P-type ATPase, SERCA-type [Sarcina ventriculi]MDO4401747.1 calcium-translocating P-type ATPase, SERCA-type [Clostridiaceae bacterium]MBU5321433.1 calcium-translocating P-type ATPase, SERCA-type [Sarcina ventriculi]MCI5636488.1 calcium-translocating P-type ATPase, SERCA-type [Sarcina ventriculi]MDD7373454.1 calcium-translocating P-type ATPase, SERCA-type [Sarcina ventriculi]MDY7062842.1 calcium-translocating P-type ATPase, SERCA-type [Sarcina ventriculi]
MQEKEVIRGLTSSEAQKGLEKYGPNEIMQKKKISPIKIFLAQFNDFMVWVLIGATIISGFMGDIADAVTISIIVVINAFLGFIQEFKTEKSLDALKSLAAPTCKVLRDGNIKIVNASEVTIGDVIILETGDRVPADGAIIECNNLMVDESLLTGESVGVNKGLIGNSSNIFMGTTVLKGKGSFRVTQVGMGTKMGEIADDLQNIEDEKSPLRERLDSLGKILVVLCIIVCVLVTVLGVLRGNDLGEMFLLGVSLAVAAIPEGLAAIVTVSLALGVSRMLKRKALVRKLPAVETLGCTSVICSDKTGTLTQNKMTVKEVFMNGKIYKIDDEKLPENNALMKSFVYCNDCNYNFSKENIEEALYGDPTETALIKLYFNDVNLLKNKVASIDRVFDIPFDSIRKMMSVIVKENGKEICYVKGAPERLINKCTHIYEDGTIKPLTHQKKTQILDSVENMSNRALRCIGGAYKENNLTRDEKTLENNLIFLGIAGIIDPPRPEVKEAVKKCRLAGIRPVMITGDHKNTAYAIGKDLNIVTSKDQVITGEELEKINDEELKEKVKNIRIFARVTPKHKLRIVRAFKQTGNIVAMTGDGVNDAPAIKEADIGIAMGISGTDVTKEASAMILMDDNFSTIVSAVEEGRTIYDNIRKFIRYLLSCNLGEVLTMFLASLFYLPTPMLPIQILFVNLATDGLPAIALGVDPADKDIMNQQPRDKKEGVFARGLTEKILVRGCLIGICTLLSFIGGMYYGMSLETCRTMALATLVMSQLFHVFECRSERHSIFEIKLFSNPYLVLAVLSSVIMLLSIIYVPFLRQIFHTTALGINNWLLVLFCSSVIFFINSVYLFIKVKK